MPGTEDIVGAARNLPEIYQPIYGHPEVTSSRTADGPRMSAIYRVVDLLSGRLDRSLRILDLGSAQGYVAFSLAEHGHHVTGIDFFQDNVDVSKMIAEANPSLSVEFLTADVVQIDQVVDLGGYDLVLGLSVLHHIVHRDGQPRARALVQTIAKEIQNGVFEMALAAEPVYWAGSLPVDPRLTISPYAFIRQVCTSPTHLSGVQRPVFFCSQASVLLNGELRNIDRWTTQSHSQGLSHQLAARRYFTVGNVFVKQIARFHESAVEEYISKVRDELRREARLLPVLAAGGLEVPQVVEFVDSAAEMLLARTSYPGRLLSEVADQLNERQRAAITHQVLHQLAALQEKGFYHADLRLWNVIYSNSDEDARIIDFGVVFARPLDVVWPHDPFYSLVLFLTALWSGNADQTGIEAPRSINVDSANLPARVAGLVASLASHRQDPQVFRDCYLEWCESEHGLMGGHWPDIPLAWNDRAPLSGGIL